MFRTKPQAGAEAILKTIYGLADHLTGVPRYFSIGGSTASEGTLADRRERDAKERGEIPWNKELGS